MDPNGLGDVPLVERDDLLERLRGMAVAAEGGAGVLVAVAGEAGVGKTAVVRAALRAVPAAWGHCEPLATPRPLGPFHDIARQLWPDSADAARLGVADMRERLLDRLRREPGPLVIEDAHWIDAASADVLRFVGRRIEASSGLIVVTFRDELGVGHPLRAVLGELATVRGFTRLDVPPLTRVAVARLVASTSVDAAEAYRLTGGNAFLLTQLVLNGNEGVAASVRDAVAARVQRLSTPARELVELLSVVPGRVDATLLGGPDASVWAAVDEAVTAGLLQVRGPVLEFRHELVRLAVEEELTPGRRLALHADVLSRLSALDDVEPTVVAHHARGAGDLRLAGECERLAAERAVAIGSHREAAQHYRRALAEAMWASAAERSDLWLALSREEYLNGREAAADDAGRRAVELRPPGTDPMRRGAAMRWWARTALRTVDCGRRERDAVEILRPLGPSVELAGAYALVATNRMINRELPVAVEWADRAIALATEVGDTESVVAALQAAGSARTLLGDDPECAQLWQAVRLAKEVDLDGELGRAYANLVSAAGEAHCYAHSNAGADEALTYFASHDVDSFSDYTRAWHGRCLFEQGRWAEAAAVIDELIATAAWRAVNGPSMVVATTVRGRLLTRRGEPGGWPVLDEAHLLADAESVQRAGPVAAGRAEARWLTGKHDDGTDGLRRCYELAVLRSYSWAIGELGLWMWRHGLLDALPAAAAEPYRRQVDGDPAGAGRVWLELGCPYEAADAWCDAADESVVRDALELFTELGARPGRQRAARRLRELGVRSVPRGPRVSTAADPDGLTAREREVLGWLRTGSTDAEIAARLHLSVKTVGHHVSAILRKTGSRSRRELRSG